MARFNFNRSPYFDDFKSSKNFMKILFKPGRPVQARELNQIQSIFQNQIEKFANHIFKNSSRISNARANLNDKDYVRLENFIPNTILTNYFDDPETNSDESLLSYVGLNPSNPFTTTELRVSQFKENAVVRGEFSGVEALIIKGIDAENGDPPTLYLVYTKTAIDGKTASFVNGEILSFFDRNGVRIFQNSGKPLYARVRCPSCDANATQNDLIPPTGKGKIFNIDEGIFYYEGMFIENSRQDIIISKYGAPLDVKIGFDFIQSIISSDNDSTLLDNALGYPNKSSPGADRYKCELNLVARPHDYEDGENFILLATYLRGGFNYLKADSEYSDIMDMIARRDYETHGNYTASKFKVRFINDKATNKMDPLGFSVDGSENHLQAIISPGIAYVKGYRHERVIDTFVRFEKARDTKKISKFIKRFEEKTFIRLKPYFANGNVYPNDPTNPVSFEINSKVLIKERDKTPGSTPFNLSTKAPNGATIGSFKVYDVVKESGIIGSSVPSEIPVFRYYIYDLKMNEGKTLADAGAFYDSGQVYNFTNVLADSGIINNPNKSELLWKIDRDHIKTLRTISEDPNPPGSIIITIRKKLTGVLNSLGSITFNSNANEFFESFDENSTIAILRGIGQNSGVFETIRLQSNNISIDPTNMVVTLSPSDSGKTITIIHNVTKVNVQEDSKLYSKTILDNIDPQDSNTWIDTGIADVYNIKIKSHLIGSTNELDVTDFFDVDYGIKDYAYESVKIKIKMNEKIETNHVLKIYVDYFSHNRPIGYFNVDSFRSILNDPTIDVNYEDIPSFTASNKIVYPLLSSFDFRPTILPDSIIGGNVPASTTTSIFDIEYYLNRIDLLCINKFGEIYPQKGYPDDTPTPPKIDSDSMALYEVHLLPYTYNLSDIKTKYIENKRYTMRDIGKLEERIKNIEYYVVLNLLEKSAADMKIKDADGFDRFKNGFIADNFESFQAADLSSPDFSAAIDSTVRELRPKFTPRNKKLKIREYGSSVKALGHVLINDFDHFMIDEQPFATKHISVNPYFQYKKMGKMILTPNNDVWADTETIPAITVEIDTGSDALTKVAEASGILGSKWGSWTSLNSTVVGTSVDVRNTTNGGTVTTTKTTTETSQKRSGTNTTIETRRDSYDLGTSITDVKIDPYMRETSIQFFASGMKPNTIVYPFFDKKPVLEYCKMLNGGEFITDSNGQISGTFNVPKGMFFTGDRDFYLTNDKNLSGDPDIETTAAIATFFSGGLDLKSQQTTMNIITPQFNRQELSENRIITDTQTTISVWNPPAPPSPDPGPPPPSIDPIAQSFKLKTDCFITSIDIFFEYVDLKNDKLIFSIRNMVNGYPGEQILSERIYNMIDIKQFESEDSTTPFRIEWNFPVYIQKDIEYCFVVQGYSPDTRIWVARLGQEVVNQPGKIIETQPTLGSSFRSQNATTWNAEQYEDIKYRIYIAKFKSLDMDLKFTQMQESVNLMEDPFEAEIGKNLIRVYMSNHGFNKNDKVTIGMGGDSWIPIGIQPGHSGDIRPTQEISTSGGFKGIIHDVRVHKEGISGALFDIQIRNSEGSFNVDENFLAAGKELTVNDNFIVQRIGMSSSHTNIHLNEFYGKFKSDMLGGLISGTSEKINGISISELNKTHVIIEVDSQNTFIIQVNSNALNTGRFGGAGIRAYMNEKYEIFNVSGSYLPYQSIQSWKHIGIGHNPINGVFESENYQTMKEINFIPGQDVHLIQPYKIATTQNEIEHLGTSKQSVTIFANFKSPSYYLSPVINADTFSITTISNNVGWFNESNFVQDPNSVGRYKPETDPMNGSEEYKYVTKTIQLKDPASDLVVAFDVYKDIFADFDIYIKTLSVYNTSDIDSLNWKKLTGYDKTFTSSDLTKRVEVEVTCSEIKTMIGDQLSDWNSDDLFGAFKIKIVGKAKNPAKPPLFQSFRAIAVL